jgi:nucleotide-binding universal stress UspA family protein
VKRLSRVLVAVDLTGESLEAFDRGLALARAHGASLYVLHAVPADRAYGWRAGTRFTRMAELRARATDAGVEIETVEQHGDPAEIIVVHAAARRPDIVLLGTAMRERGHEPAPIVERVLQRVGCPVLCVPGRPAAAPTHAFRHVLFAVRDAESVATGLKAIVRLTGGVDRVTLLHVLPELVADRARWYAWRTLHGPDERARIRQTRRELEMAIPPEVRAKTDVGVRVLRGSARGVIVRVADHMNVDLLVLGMSRRPFIRLLGSTTTRLVREAARPVLVLPVHRPLTEGEEPVRSRLRAA